MAVNSASPNLRLVDALARDRDAADGRFRLGLVAARAAGESVSAIASAARLSTSRTSELLEREGATSGTLSRDTIDWLLENAFDVVIVPAGQLALRDFEDLSAYVCQPGRTFRDATRVGFYAAASIDPRFPRIRRTVDHVPFTSEEVSRLRAAGDDELASTVDAFIASPDRRGHRPGRHKVMLLTAPDDPETFKLKQPIRHLVRGRGQAFVRKQRYTTMAALRHEPEPATTADLLRYERP
jgi:hypothetical protein